jgi:guanylate kinase
MSTLQSVAPQRTTAPVLVTVGPSGSGKSSVVAALAGAGVLCLHPTWTTRPPRAGETLDQGGHRFVSDEEFDRAVEERRFMATGQMDGLPFRYGLPTFEPTSAGSIDTIAIRARYVPRLRATLPSVVVYAFDAPSWVTDRRLARRGVTPIEVAARSRDNRDERIVAGVVADRTFRSVGGVHRVAARVERALLLDCPGRNR